MRIGLVLPGFSAHAADWCIPALRHLVRCLAATDDVRVVAVRYPYRRSRYVIDGATVFAVGGAQRRGRATFELWCTALRLLAAEHRRRPFDVLHAFWATESGLLAAMAGRLLGLPALVSLAGGELVDIREIGYGDQRFLQERMKVRASLRLATAVSGGSQLLVEMASQQVRRDRRHRAPLGVDTSLFTPPRLRSRQPRSRRLVHVGTLIPVKDQMTLLRAFARLPASHSSRADPPRLDIIGNGPLRTELQRLALELGVAERVCFRGEVDHADLPAILRGAAACVVSSRHEAQCMAALEAAACGVPLVGTRVGVVPELTGAVVGVGDESALADALAATLASADPTDALVNRVRADFSLATCTARFRDLYARLA